MKMLRPYKMYSVIITGPKTLQEDIIKELHDMKVLHIVEHSKNDMADIGTPLESANRLSEILVKIRALIAALNVKKQDNDYNLKEGLADVETTAIKLNEEATASLDNLKKIDELMSKNNSAKPELEILKDIRIPIEYFSSYKSLAYFTGFVKDTNHLSAIKVELSLTVKNFMFLDSLVNKRMFVVLFVDAKSNENTLAILQNNGFAAVNFMNISNLKGSASANLKKIDAENARLQKEKDEIKKKILKLSEDYKGFLLAAEEFLAVQLEKAEAPLKFASTPSSFLIKGWIPNEDLHKSIERLNKASKNKIYVEFEEARKKDNVPVKLRHSKYVKPFEFFIDLYSIPNFTEIDPTFFIFLTFPIFFGAMLGDIGYGITSLIIFWILRKKMPNAKNFFNILMLASFVSVLFGFLYGEFFGLEEIGTLHLWHLLSRANDMFTLLYIALAIGAIHVNIGLAIGFINVFKEHGFIAAIYEKASWIVLEIGVAMITLSYIGKISLSAWVGWTFMAASVLMLFKGEGVKGIMELPSIFTNILSYARLMAIGLSSVELAIIINNSSKDLFHLGSFYILIGILILVIGHIINLLLGLLGSFLHSLRLHYVEFFSKFFHGGAKKYQPFGMRED